MWSGRTLVLLSFASVAVALLVSVIAGWRYGLALYAASLVLFGWLLRRMIRQLRDRRPAAPNHLGADKRAPGGMVGPRS